MKEIVKHYKNVTDAGITTQNPKFSTCNDFKDNA
jgi:hypothetical protein